MTIARTILSLCAEIGDQPRTFENEVDKMIAEHVSAAVNAERERCAKLCERMEYLEQSATRAMNAEEMSRADAFREAASQIRTGEEI